MEINHKNCEKRILKNFEIIPDPLENSGENCWTACHENPGKCDWCGTEGLCCRKGFKVNECDGLAGVESEHQCILKGNTFKSNVSNMQYVWEYICEKCGNVLYHKIYIPYVVTDCQCPTLQVSFANEALAHQSIKPGLYQLADKINGKSSWKSATHAIWSSNLHNHWMIGAVKNIGTNTGSIYHLASDDRKKYDCPQQVPTHLWVYWHKEINDWKQGSSNDISFQCAGKHVFLKSIFILKIRSNTLVKKKKYV